MECSCGSSNFQPGKSSVAVNDALYRFEFASCASCGRRGGERLFDADNRLYAYGYDAAVMVQRAFQAAPESVDPDLAVPPEARPVVVDEVAEKVPPNPPSDPEGSRNYFIWEAQAFTVYVLYYHAIPSDGHDSVTVPWLGRTWHEEAVRSSDRYIALDAYDAIRTALEQQFGCPALHTSVTCAPPQALPYAVRRSGEPVAVLFESGERQALALSAGTAEQPATDEDAVYERSSTEVRAEIAPQQPFEEQLSLF
jgi:hypothetical protein